MKRHSGKIRPLHPRFRTTKEVTPLSFSALSLLWRRVFSGPLLLSFPEPRVAYSGGLLYPTSLLFHTTTLEHPWCTTNIPPRELGVSQKLPETAIKIRTDLNQNRNPFLRMCRQSISTDKAKSGGTWYSPAMTCSAAKASSSQKKHF